MVRKRNDDTDAAERQMDSVSDTSARQRVSLAIGLPVWTTTGFLLASLLVSLLITLLLQVNLITPAIDGPVFSTTVAALVYALAIIIVVGAPWKLFGHRTTREEMGLTRFPSWMDIGLAPAGFIVYLLLAGILLSAITGLFPAFNADEAQQIGFENLSRYYEYILAFTTLVVIAPIAEELLVRGYLYGKLRKIMPVAGAVAVSALLFAMLHVGLTDEQGNFAIMQLNVALNVLPLGIVLALLRETTGSIWASVLLHMIKNGVAFYILFVNPALLHTIGG